MITENEHYRLELIPKWVRKKMEYETVSCSHCNGTGYGYPDELSFHWAECKWCFGTGAKQIPKELPPPPNIDMDFVSFMRKAFQEYARKEPVKEKGL